MVGGAGRERANRPVRLSAERDPHLVYGCGYLSDQPSQILQSARFAETFVRLASWFDWVVIDSPPMLPMVDANLWSRVVDGTLVRCA